MDKKDKNSQSGVSRRDLLKSLSYGVAAAAAAPMFGPRAQAQASTFPVSSDTTVLSGGALPGGVLASPTGEASFGGGLAFVRTQMPDGSNTDLQFVDLHSMNLQFSFNEQFGIVPDANFYKLPLTDNQFIYTAHGSTIYSVLPDGSVGYSWPTEPLPAPITSELRLVGSLLLLITADGVLRSFDPVKRLAGWTAQLAGSGTGATFDTSSATVFVASGGQLQAFALDTGAQMWSVTAVPGTVACGSAIVAILGTDGYLRTYDPSNGGVALWTFPQQGSPLNGPTSPPLYYNGSFYIADATGKLRSVLGGPQQGTETPAVALPVGFDQTQPLLIEDGILYGSQAGSTLTVFAVQLSDGTPLSYSTQQQGRFLGVENGTCFFTHDGGAAVAGVSMSRQLHGFFAESELMADDYPGGTVKAQGTSYRVHVKLQDENNNPRVNKSVKVWVTDPAVPDGSTVTLSVNDATTTVSDQQDAVLWTTTDGQGELSIVYTATDVTCPPIYLWGTFMFSDEAMIIYADHQSTAQLSTVQGSDLSTASDYSNSLILGSNVGMAGEIATHIQNTMGGASAPVSGVQSQPGTLRSQPPSNLRHRRRPVLGDTPSYVSYPGAAPNLIYQSGYVPGQDIARTFYPSNAVAGTLTLTGNSAVFQAGVVPPPALTFSLSHWRDVWKAVVHAVENVVQVVVTIANDAAKTVMHAITTATQTFYLVIDSVEAAVTAVASVLKSAVNDIKSAVEWLSYLFAWGDMVTNAKSISTEVQTRLTSFSQWITQNAASAETYIGDLFPNPATTIQNAFTPILTALGGSSVQSQQQGGNNPQTVYNKNGVNTYTKTQWMNSKIKSNVNNTQTSSSAVSGQLGDDPFLNAGETFITFLKNKLASDYQNLPGNLQGSLSNLGSFMQDPGGFVTHLMTDILEKVEEGLILLIDFVIDVIEAFIAALSELVTGTLGLITDTISMPVITELWGVITGNDPTFPLTFLNLFSLLLSIPATIITKAFKASPTADSNAGDFGEDVLTTAKVVNGLIYAGFDTLSDVTDAPPFGPIALAGIALSAVGFLLGIPQPLPQQDALSFVWWAASALPLVNAGYNYYVNKNKIGSYQLTNSQGGSTNGLYGVFMLGFSVVGAIKDPTDFDGSSHLKLLGNLFTYIPYFGKAFAEGPSGSPARIAVGVIDAVGDVSSTIISAV